MIGVTGAERVGVDPAGIQLLRAPARLTRWRRGPLRPTTNCESKRGSVKRRRKSPASDFLGALMVRAWAAKEEGMVAAPQRAAQALGSLADCATHRLDHLIRAIN